MHVNIYINGIMNWPGCSKNWNGRAVTRTHLVTDGAISSEKIEYFCGPIGRAFGQKRRAEKLAATIQYYLDRNWSISLIGHSNGTDVILKALAWLNWPQIAALHLVSGACNANFYTNGLNAALASGAIGQVHVYVGGRDLALRCAHGLAGRLLGYGTLGLHGPQHVGPAVADRVHVVTWPEFGHSDCFNDDHFEQTVDHFLQP